MIRYDMIWIVSESSDIHKTLLVKKCCIQRDEIHTGRKREKATFKEMTFILKEKEKKQERRNEKELVSTLRNHRLGFG